MSADRLMMIGLVTVMLCGQHDLQAELPELNAASWAAYQDAVEPTEAESAYLDIAWHSQLGDAVRDAHHRELPLMIYVMNGHPLACT